MFLTYSEVSFITGDIPRVDGGITIKGGCN
jgi:hypothetical protein